ncbi:hypothetical protein UACE39S_04828 [Ureibacillus acetophenoni]
MPDPPRTNPDELIKNPQMMPLHCEGEREKMVYTSV